MPTTSQELPKVVRPSGPRAAPTQPSIVVEHKKALSASVQMLAMLSSAVDCSSDAIVVADGKGVIRVYNPAAAEMFGYAADLALGDNIFYLLESVLVESDKHRLNNALGSGRPIRNLRVQIADLTTRKPLHVLLTVSTQHTGDESGQVTVATIKDNSEAEAVARTDALTGLANRHELQGRMQRDQQRLLRGQLTCLSVIAIDVDHFRDFNTKFGHMVGDEVLRHVGIVLRESVRGVDMAARPGGEEFLVLLPDTPEEGAMMVAARIRETLAAMTMQSGVHSALRVTASLGVATGHGSETVVQMLLQEADERLYKAKAGGRNRVWGSGTR